MNHFTRFQLFYYLVGIVEIPRYILFKSIQQFTGVVLGRCLKAREKEQGNQLDKFHTIFLDVSVKLNRPGRNRRSIFYDENFLTQKSS
jgi:hypothetical protein